jgi:hypothetical protein
MACCDVCEDGNQFMSIQEESEEAENDEIK